VRRLFVLLVVVTFASAQALAAPKQTPRAPKAAPTPKAEPKAEPKPPPEEPAPPYEADLSRLSEILGSVHYLRGLCGGADGNVWRDDMTALIDSESPGPLRRARLVASFNRGYRSVSETHRQCTPATRVLIDRYLGEGARLARDIAARYGT
jgi:uncharacterized protein (TIGR02301 family)